MVNCPKCGAYTKEDDNYCNVCGSSIQAKVSIIEQYPKKKDYFDYSGLLSFGFLLLIVATIFLENSKILDNLRLWIEQMVLRKDILRPPNNILVSGSFFFALLGLSDFIIAGVRFIYQKQSKRAIGEILSGIALLLFSYLIYLYRVSFLPWQTILAIEGIVCGLLIIFYSVLPQKIFK